MENAPQLLMMVILFVITGLIVTSTLFLEDVRASSSNYVAPDTSKCSSSSDCSRGICISINGQPSSCGCIDDVDCGGGMNCENNECVEP